MTSYKFKLFSSEAGANLPNIGDMAEYEELMTRSYNDDSIVIVQKETKLTEMGQYLVALHWIETGNSSKDAQVLKEVLESGV